MIPYLRNENLKNHAPSRGMYLYSPYMGVPPSPGPNLKRMICANHRSKLGIGLSRGSSTRCRVPDWGNFKSWQRERSMAETWKRAGTNAIFINLTSHQLTSNERRHARAGCRAEWRIQTCRWISWETDPTQSKVPNSWQREARASFFLEDW